MVIIPDFIRWIQTVSSESESDGNFIVKMSWGKFPVYFLEVHGVIEILFQHLK